MCRSIKPLRQPDREPTDQELQEAALQFVRKISGYRKPPLVHQEAFDAAVHDVATVARTLFDSLPRRAARARSEPGAQGRPQLTAGQAVATLAE